MYNNPSRPPVFLDRDGTIIVEKQYLCDPALVEFEACAVEGLKLLQSLGHMLIMVSNQSGVGRGKFTVREAHRVNQRVAELLLPHGIHIAAWYMCPHAPNYSCTCRKPLPGMPRAAATELGVSLLGAYVIGDKRIDVELAHAIGGTGILVTTGHGLEHSDWAHSLSLPVTSHLLGAAEFIARHQSARLPATLD